MRRVAEIERLWNGEPAEPSESTSVEVELDGDRLRVAVDAPYHDDPPPAVPAGRCERLWEYEVVELFLVAASGRYLELEVGPHGHFLCLELSAPREVTRERRDVELHVERSDGRWRGRAELTLSFPPARWNAFAIHGVGVSRRYLAAHPLGGSAPDFHRVSEFPAWPLA